MTSLQRLVARVVEEAHLSASPEPIVGWLTALERWNQRVDLTAARTREELVDLMVADAAMLASRLEAGRSVVDVGTGAGAPGLPLAMLRPDLQVTLVEPMHKRVALLRMSAGRAKLSLRVIEAKGEDLEDHFDVAVSRATLSPERWLEVGGRIADEVWVLLARREAPQLAGWKPTADCRYAWPLTGAERRAVAYRAENSEPG